MSTATPTADPNATAPGTDRSAVPAGSRYVRSFDEVADAPRFRQWLHREFPQAAEEFPEGLSRRRWLQLMGASLTMAGAAGCRWEAEELVPMAIRSAERLPGVPLKFATSWELGGVGRSLLVTSVDGRPVKIEGNPDHPQNGPVAPGGKKRAKNTVGLGGSGVFDQAMILDLYDPDRSRGPAARETKGGPFADRRWDEARGFLRTKLGDGTGVRFLAEPSSSPTLRRVRDELVESLPNAGWVEYTPLSRDESTAGAKLAFGRPLRVRADLSDAAIILCLDADPLGDDPDHLAHTRAWAARRSPEDGSMNRLYSVESQYSQTGTAADHRYPLASTRIPQFLAQIEREVERRLGGGGGKDAVPAFVRAVAEDLAKHRGTSAVLCGHRQQAAVHARVHRLNSLLGNVGKTVFFSEEPAAAGTGDAERPTHADAIRKLADEMRSGAVRTLIVLRGNPAYDAPADVKFTEALAKVPLSIHFGTYRDETARLCDWHLPATHPLESWGDARTWDGTYTVQQPLIAPLFGGKTDAEFVSWLTEAAPQGGYELTRATFEAVVGGGEDGWKTAVHAGFAEGTAFPPVSADAVGDAPELPADVGDGTLELVFTASESTLDGRFANNGWLQECPDYLTKLVWDNAAIVGPTTAAELGVEFGDLLTITVGGVPDTLPVYVLPGQARGSIGVSLGYGRRAAGVVGGNVGADLDEEILPVGTDVYPLRPGNAWVIPSVQVAKTPGSYDLVTTQDHHAIDRTGMEQLVERVPELIREGTVEQFAEHPDFAEEMVHHPELESLWQAHEYEGRRWGMAIDLSKCTGCNSCVVACQSENNVPVVGKDQVDRGREMHWLRMDRYFTPNLVGEDGVRHGEFQVEDVLDPAAFDNAAAVGQPLMCVHCENAPCEQVCPVAATVHDAEGLNSMIYNRCVGTRYCSNNCPYKVRRFNWLNYNKRYEDANVDLAGMVLNPEVTVRSRGVMEKCTYCVQRINYVKIEAKNDGRAIEDGEIVTACQQACPAGAIVFGDLADRSSQARRLHENPRAYKLLSELNVRPRTAYLARIRNPHELLAKGEAYYRPLGAHGHEGGDRHGSPPEGDPHHADDAHA